MYSWPSRARHSSTPTQGHVIAGYRVGVMSWPSLRGSRRSPSLACLQSLIDVPEDIIERFESDREAHHLRRDAGGALLVFVELAMRRRRRMDDQGLRISDVGQVRQELHRLDESNAGCGASLDAEGQDSSGAVWKIASRHLFIAVSLEQGVAHPFDAGVRREMPRDGQRRLAVARHAQVQRLDSLQQHERAERRKRGSERSHGLHARLHRESEIAEGLVEYDAMIAARRHGHLRKLAV